MMTEMTVPDTLQSYVHRGVFKSFNAHSDARNFDFVWLNRKRMHLQWNANRNAIVFKDVLADIPARSRHYRELRAYLKGRMSPELPAHRRLDPELYDLICENRKSVVSVGLKVKSGGEEAAVRRLMGMVHEMFLYHHDRWPEYMYETFGSPLE